MSLYIYLQFIWIDVIMGTTISDAGWLVKRTLAKVETWKKNSSALLFPTATGNQDGLSRLATSVKRLPIIPDVPGLSRTLPWISVHQLSLADTQRVTGVFV